MSKIFICYRHADSAVWAGRLSDWLRQSFGEDDVFMDIHGLEPGVDFEDEIGKQVGSCDVLIAVIGTKWLTVTDEQGARRLNDPDDLTRLEIAAALQRDVRVVPALVDGAEMPTKQQLPTDLNRLARRQAYRLSAERWVQDVEGLIAALKKYLSPPQANLPGTTVVPKAGGSPRQAGVSRDAAIRDRLMASLREHKDKWRGVKYAAKAAGLSEEEAAKHFRAMSEVRLAKGRSGRPIVGLLSRVGPKGPGGRPPAS
jgi:hypothetical protein